MCLLRSAAQVQSAMNGEKEMRLKAARTVQRLKKHGAEQGEKILDLQVSD